MKHLHKFASVLLALVMAFSLMAPAFAAPNTTISQPTTTANVTIPTLENHNFKAYAIFTGTQAESEGDLADVKWGTDFPSTAFLTALAAADKTVLNGTTAFTADMSAAQAAEAIAQYTDETAAANLIAQIAYNAIKGSNMAGTDLQVNQSNNLPTGYYLIVDTTTNLAEGDAVNPALLQLTDDITIKVKVEVPKVDKEVKENREGGDYDEAADYAIGDMVPFKFTSAVPDMSQYETYSYVFHDKMGTGLTFTADTAKLVVTIGDTTLVANTDYTLVTEGLSDECTFELRIADLKTIAAATTGATIVVTFEAELNSNAVVGQPGNSNKVQLEYPNNPNDQGEGNTNKTPEEEVKIFTYGLINNKVDGTNEAPLAGAHFRLARTVDGKREWATTTTVEEKTKISGWVPSPTEGDDFVVTADGNVYYAGGDLVSGEDGVVQVAGLDHGTYELWEVKAPDGYNTPNTPFAVVISSELVQTDGSESFKNLSATVGGKNATADQTTGTVTGTIENNSGATLPETGGIGTTIFYVVGGLLTVGAVVLLVTKKRMSADSDK